MTSSPTLRADLYKVALEIALRALTSIAGGDDDPVATAGKALEDLRDAGLVTRAAAKEKVMAERWKPGDRVKLLLPDHTRKVGRGYSDAWFTGTVREVDPPGLLPGVQVDLDQPVSGVSDCYATHGELVPLEASDA